MPTNIRQNATEEVCPADISEEIAERMKALTVRAFQALKLNVYSRADFILDVRRQSVLPGNEYPSGHDFCKPPSKRSTCRRN